MIKTYKKIKTFFFLDKKLYPEKFSFKKFRLIIDKYSIYKKIICLPDLDFKIKNFVPSGVVIPTKKYFSPELLGPNNDSMLAIKFSIKSKKIKKKELNLIFKMIKKEISLFRRFKPVVKNNDAKNILKKGSKGLPKSWNIHKNEIKNIFNDGYEKISQNKNMDKLFSSTKLPKTLPTFVKSKSIIDGAKKCIGVLDGTSHFIDLYKLNNLINPKECNNYNLKKNNFFFLIHAGSGDPGLILHHKSLENKNSKFNLNTKVGTEIFNFSKIAANFGYVNRIYIYSRIKFILKNIFKESLENIEIFSDLPHDYLDLIKEKNIFLHRKGAVKFQKSNAKKKIPYLFPSCPGGDGYILTSKNNKKTYDCVSHGAGRIVSKKNSLIYFKNKNFINELRNKTIFYRYNKDNIYGHHPKAFKNLKKIISLIKKYRLGKPIAKCKMLASLKA